MRTVDSVPGNLPVQVTSIVGRDLELKELCELVRAHRLVTLTGVGGVGKTRLAVHVAAELVAEFPDGVWLVELAPVGDPAAVPNAVAGILGVSPTEGLTVTDSIAQALARRRLLIVLDNCEHVLDAAAEFMETVLARTQAVKVIATSREGSRVGAEHLWPVPSLDDQDGGASAAVELYVQRAQAVNPGFGLEDPSWAEAVAEICRRLDGIPLAIELAAARMVSMSPAEVRDRLGERFKLLSGSRRGLERHQTLRHAVRWSYDLLDEDERAVLGHCSVFADGFDLAAATHVCDSGDEYAVLDVLDSLVRKSLVTAKQFGDRTRYGMLETIRQFAEDQLGTTSSQARDRHARYFADEALAHWEIWDGPRQRVAHDWVEAEFANLRAGFGWAADQDDLTTATAIAAHTSMLAFHLQRYEPLGWAEDILEAAAAADLPQLPRLYTAVCWSIVTGGAEAAVEYARTAAALETDPRYDPFPPGWASWMEIISQVFVAQIDRAVEVAATLSAQPGFARVAGLTALLNTLPAAGRAEEAMSIADETLAAARAYGNPVWIGFALNGCGRAFSESDPARAQDAFREGLAYTPEHRLLLWEAIMARDAAELEAVYGDLEAALELFDATIDAFDRAASVSNVAMTLGNLAVLFDRIEQPEIAATIYGGCTRDPATSYVVNLPGVIDHLRTVLGDTTFESHAATGAAMELTDAVQYARHQIQLARRQVLDLTGAP